MSGRRLDAWNGSGFAARPETSRIGNNTAVVLRIPWSRRLVLPKSPLGTHDRQITEGGGCSLSGLPRRSGHCLGRQHSADNEPSALYSSSGTFLTFHGAFPERCFLEESSRRVRLPVLALCQWCRVLCVLHPRRAANWAGLSSLPGLGRRRCDFLSSGA